MFQKAETIEASNPSSARTEASSEGKRLVGNTNTSGKRQNSNASDLSELSPWHVTGLKEQRKNSGAARLRSVSSITTEL